jgi:hypothetical protein
MAARPSRFLQLGAAPLTLDRERLKYYRRGGRATTAVTTRVFGFYPSGLVTMRSKGDLCLTRDKAD